MLSSFSSIGSLLVLSHCVFAFSPTQEVTRETIHQQLPTAKVQTDRATTGAIKFRINMLPPHAGVAKPEAYLILILDGKELGTIVLSESPLNSRMTAESTAEAFTARFVIQPEIAKESKLRISYAVLDSDGVATSSYALFDILLGTFIPRN